MVLPKVPMGQSPDTYAQKVSQVKLYEDFTLSKHFNQTHRLTSEVIATTALWAEQHKQTKVMLGDIPLSVFKYNLINSVPLLDLERAFEKVHYRTFADDCSPYEAALKEVPELVLGLSDEYLAAMIYKASETYKNIMVVCGYG